MIHIEIAEIQHVPIIHKLAIEIWQDTYQDILSQEQIDFMLAKMYSETALQQQFEEGFNFLLMTADEEPVAFAAYSFIDEEFTKIHKLYISHSQQGKGTGRLIIDYIIEKARMAKNKFVELNVNRMNPALGFYKKLGFVIYQTVDIPYYQFEMNDYVMRLSI